MKHVGLQGWQVGCLFGLMVGLAQAMTGSLELASLPVEEGIARLAATMVGSAVLCALGAGVMSSVAGSNEPSDRE